MDPTGETAFSEGGVSLITLQRPSRKDSLTSYWASDSLPWSATRAKNHWRTTPETEPDCVGLARSRDLMISPPALRRRSPHSPAPAARWFPPYSRRQGEGRGKTQRLLAAGPDRAAATLLTCISRSPGVKKSVLQALVSLAIAVAVQVSEPCRISAWTWA